VGGKTGGFYAVTGSPHTVWRIENPNPGQINQVRVTKTVGGVSETSLYEYSYTQDAWSLISPDGLEVISQSQTRDYSRTVFTISEVIKSASGQVAEKSSRVMKKYDFGDRELSRTLDPEGANLRTLSTYYTDVNQPGSYGRVATRSYPTGDWIVYRYDEMGRLSQETQPWLNASFNSEPAKARATYYSYEPLDERDVVRVDDI